MTKRWIHVHVDKSRLTTRQSQYPTLRKPIKSYLALKIPDILDIWNFRKLDKKATARWNVRHGRIVGRAPCICDIQSTKVATLKIRDSLHWFDRISLCHHAIPQGALCFSVSRNVSPYRFPIVATRYMYTTRSYTYIEQSLVYICARARPACVRAGDRRATRAAQYPSWQSARSLVQPREYVWLSTCIYREKQNRFYLNAAL